MPITLRGVPATSRIRAARKRYTTRVRPQTLTAVGAMWKRYVPRTRRFSWAMRATRANLVARRPDRVSTTLTIGWIDFPGTHSAAVRRFLIRWPRFVDLADVVIRNRSRDLASRLGL